MRGTLEFLAERRKSADEVGDELRRDLVYVYLQLMSMGGPPQSIDVKTQPNMFTNIEAGGTSEDRGLGGRMDAVRFKVWPAPLEWQGSE